MQRSDQCIYTLGVKVGMALMSDITKIPDYCENIYINIQQAVS